MFTAEVIYIKDQKEGNGLTGTWNKGINYFVKCSKVKYEVITILGHDTYLNKSFNKILELATIAQKNKNQAIKYAEGGYKKGTPLEADLRVDPLGAMWQTALTKSRK